ncbi:hypothetical protein LA324_05305 [Corynebacterium coyleae]|uniref:hypothetical protein n=1 Tax=Corynebacterium coyleae TaxID=53374 RepID=UPI001CCD56D8|nr:hypothetical protein [Corynebacterium coyleae]UBI10027.1 hypothetical protein LA324_05305 [Corynebacterium coyleae]
MFDTMELEVGAFEPAITVYRDHEQGTGWAIYEFYPTSNDGVLYDYALLTDVRDILKGLVLDVNVADYSDEDWPVVEIAVRVDGVDPEHDGDELYSQLLPITVKMNDLEIDSYIEYE